MKLKILGLTFLFAFFISLTPSAAWACGVEDDSGAVKCIPRERPGSTVLVASIASAVPVNIPSGTSPSAARDVPDEWQFLDPHASVWYKTTYSDNFRMLEYWLEMNRPDVAGFAVYAPQQSDGLSAATKPIGRGTHNKNDPDNVLRWKAGYAWPGIWYVLLTNNTDQPISYKLNQNQAVVPTKTCFSYWEVIIDQPAYWTECARSKPD